MRIGDPLGEEVLHQIREIVDIAAGEAAGAGDQIGLGLQGENSGPLRMGPVRQEGQGPYAAAFNDYVRGDLKYESDLPYEILTDRVHPWSYDTHENKYVNVSETLRKAISLNPFLKVFVANGYYDLATPYYATRYTVNHLGLDPSLAANISLGFYEAGHMMYIHLPSLSRLRDDLADFMTRALPPRAGALN